MTAPHLLPPVSAPSLLTTEQAARRLGLAKRTLENKRVSGIEPIPFVKIGRRVLYDPADLDAYVAARRFLNTSEVEQGAAA
jgi:excisionase family DNA binding protein